MSRNPIHRLTALLLFALCCIAAQAASVRISVRSERGGAIHKGDLFYLVYNISDLVIDNSNGVPSPGNIPGAKLVHPPVFTTGTTFSNTFNGHSVTEIPSAVYTATFRAQESGKFTAGPFAIGNVRTNAVTYNIGGESSSSSQSSQPDPNTLAQQSASSGPKFIGKGDSDLFMRASISKTTAYEQEALIYTVKLYSTYSRLKFVGATNSPKFEGFVVEESKQQIGGQMQIESYNGRRYATAVIARYIIFPQMKGNLKVLGNQYTISVDQAEYYHDPFFGRMTVGQPLQLSVAPNDLSVNVLPLPEPKPADFCGGVGKFSISSSMPSTNLKTNENGSIVYTVSGTGNLKYITMPELATLFPPQIEVYSPETDVKVNVGSSSVTGTVKFDYSLMPNEEGDFNIPPVSITYFNPETKQYEKATAKGFNIKVGKGSASSKSQQRKAYRFDNTLMKVGSLSKTHSPLLYTFAYWLLYIIPVILLALAIIIWQKHLKDNANMSAVLMRKAGKIAAKRLKKARACMNAGQSDKFYDEMLRALWGYLGDKLKMPTSELSRDNVSEVLTQADIPADDITEVIKLLDECEFAKYSSNSGSLSMDAVYSEATDVIGRLENSFKQKKS